MSKRTVKIHEERIAGATYSSIARKHGVSASRIFQIVKKEELKVHRILEHRAWLVLNGK